VSQLILPAWGALAAVLALLWWRQLKTRNATSVDAAWSAGIGTLAIWYGLTADGDVTRRLLVASLAALWAFRLAWFLIRHRVMGHRPEDGRYRAMREHWGARAPAWFFLFYQGQAAVAVLFSLPILGAMRGGPLDARAAAGLGIWLVSVVGESLADRQLARFRDDPSHRGEVCRVGLWRYSRHPNYFFEWLHWWAYVAIGHGAWITWIGPVAMLLFLFRLTGIPWTEMQALRSRGERYRAYQRTTSVFLPWPPRAG
jgi:steroid 5-alpha reductase family enzyme